MPDGIDLSGISVALSLSTRDIRDITVPTTSSLIASIDLLNQHGIPNETSFIIGVPMPVTRSIAAHKFLKSDKTRMFILDSDLEWQATDLLKLVAQSVRYPFVGGAYITKSDPPFFPVNLKRGGIPDQYGLIPANGLTNGFSCIDRKIIEALAAKSRTFKYAAYPEPIADIFRFDITAEGAFQTEDMAFCDDVRELGYQPMCDPSIQLKHWGSRAYTARLSDYLTPQKEAAE